ncbi:cysteine desulfurase [Vagococcus coleopterorum]|uniref:cysteine desulfurase n=1 Tax=Vagococcus coleopterorum TaxID=2714946 RepID=A0A6G8AM90_9ENTE|nr:cysteine desulfurase family protein [Vagococcus coleopterorum]QIL46178.1 cysteine desulfurase [Vagococcus coleopterorum]
MPTIYFDHGGTTPIAPAVIEKMTEVMSHVYGNPSSVHQTGRTAKALLNKARQEIATSINAKEDEIIFTSGGTESDNFAIRQTAKSRQHLGRHLVTSNVEHPAVLDTMKELGKEGFDVTFLDVSETGDITPEQVAKALRPDTILVSLMWTNNETGVQFPIKEISEVLKDHQAYFHTDAVQAFGLETIDVNEVAVDLLSASAHKINGPKGVGMLFQREGVHLPAMQTGGKQETQQRAGTENIPGIVGFAEAVKLLDEATKEQRRQGYQELQTKLTTGLHDAGIEFEINGTSSLKSSHVINLWLKDLPNQQVLMQLDLAGIAISVGSACTAGAVQPSHVLEAMFGQKTERALESIRISFGLGNTDEEVATLVAELVKIKERMTSK